MKRTRSTRFLVAISLRGVLASACKSQSADVTGYSASGIASIYSSSTRPHLDLMYVRPTEKMKLRIYVFDAFGSYHSWRTARAVQPSSPPGIFWNGCRKQPESLSANLES
jgi:hypothetical protein